MLSIARLFSRCSCRDAAGGDERPEGGADEGGGDGRPEDDADGGGDKEGDSVSGLVASKVSSSGELGVQSAHHIFSRKASTEE